MRKPFFSSASENAYRAVLLRIRILLCETWEEKLRGVGGGGGGREVWTPQWLFDGLYRSNPKANKVFIQETPRSFFVATAASLCINVRQAILQKAPLFHLTSSGTSTKLWTSADRIQCSIFSYKSRGKSWKCEHQAAFTGKNKRRIWNTSPQ